MMDDLSLETILNILELCKYSEVDGENAELIISPADDNARKIRIGINGAFSREYLEYTYPNGEEFDKEILPKLVKQLLKDDKISSWVTKDPQMEEFPIKELIVSEKGNEILIQTFDKNIHEYIKENAEDIQLNEEKNTLTIEEQAAEKVLKYLKEKNKVRVELSKYDDKTKKELIKVIDKAYQLNKGKTLSDEQIYNFADNIHEGISKDCYNAIVSDIRNNNSRLINEIRDYLRNEHKYENYLDEEPYITLNEAGQLIVDKGYFDLRYAFPQKADLYKITEDKLKEIVTSRYKSKYKLLAETKIEVEKESNPKNERIARSLDIYMNYLVKTTRDKINRKTKNENKFKESYQTYKEDDFKTLIDAVKLYKGGKLDSEKLEIVVTEYVDSYGINVRLSNGVARDNNEFKFSKTDIFVTEVIPKLKEEIEKDDNFVEKRTNVDTTILTTKKGNEFFVDTELLKNVKIDIKENIGGLIEDSKKEDKKVEKLKSDSKYLSSYFRKLVLRDKGILPQSGAEEIKDLESKSDDVKDIEEAKREVEKGTRTKASYDELVENYRELLRGYVKNGLKRKPIIRNNKELKEDEFNYLHKLLKRYKVQNVDGEIRTINRTLDTEVTFNNPKDLYAVEFASYWCSAVGVKFLNDSDILGENYAFSDESKELFDIVLKNYDGEKVSLNEIKAEFEKTNIDNSKKIYDRLFKDEDHVEFVNTALKEFLRVYKDKSIDAKEENADVKEIIEEFTRLDELSDEDKTANLVINYSDDFVSVKTEMEEDEIPKATLYKKFPSDYFTSSMLDVIAGKFIEEDGIFKHRIIPNEEKETASLIVIGKNSNVLQIRNIDEKYIDKLESIIDTPKEEKDHGRRK